MGSGWEGEDVGEDKRGIIPRAIRDLFAGADERAETARSQGQLPPEFSVQAQFIELYNEDIVDLLDPAKDPFAKVCVIYCFYKLRSKKLLYVNFLYIKRIFNNPKINVR